MEADDEMGIRQDDTTIICTIDKDLDMIEGRHFNFVKNKHYMVDPATAMRNFYKQLLTGDKTDMIPGIYGLGPAKAEALLGSYNKEEEYKGVIFDAYKAHFPYCGTEDVLAHIDMVGKLLWIKRTPDEEWSFGSV
jgi:5'-3' exonuclease